MPKEIKKERILGLMIFIGLISHYVFGYFFWDKLGTEKIYSISAYFSLDIWSLVCFILARSKFLKGMGCLGMGCATYFFYMEFNDPQNWRVEDYKMGCTFILMMVNLFFVWIYTEKLRNLKN